MVEFVPKKILIIDDSPVDRKMFIRFLERDPTVQYSFVEASTGASGIAKFEELAPDCILLDYHLNDATGLEVLESLEGVTSGRATGIVMLTGHGDEQIAVRALHTGAHEYVVKDNITEEGLVRTVQNAMEKAELHARVERQRCVIEARVEELELARRAAEDANRAKGEILANMSHELRTPLTAILGYAELLHDEAASGGATDRQVEALHTIQLQGRHLLELINDALDLSKAESGHIQLELLTVEPLDQVAEVVQLLKPKSDSKGLSLEYSSRGKLPQCIDTDTTKIRQILINLVGNAIKFTEDGAIDVTIYVDDPYMVYEVRDTGPGIFDPEDGRIFEPFAQADTSTTRRYGGTGLGLSLCKRYVELMGGTIQVESELGHGTTFRVKIPLRMNIAQKHSSKVDQLQLAGCRILVVDDVATNRNILSAMLSKTSADIVSAATGQQALDRIAEAEALDRAFDLVLMDMQMPEMDGLEATTRLREKDYSGGIIAITAFASAADRERCLAAGCDAFLEKPIDRALLFRTLDNVARGKSESD